MAFVAAVLLPTTASAEYYSGGSGTNAFAIYHYPANPTWQSYMNHGPACWNATGTGTSISRTTNSSAIKKMQPGTWNTTWTGLYTPSGNRSNRAFLIQLNASRITWIRDNYPNSVPFATWARWTACHEVGHALSLDDNPSGQTYNTSIMRFPLTSVTALYTTPRIYDINDVNAFY